MSTHTRHAEAIGPTGDGEAETYQQLRSHLAYLGLTTAAEVLTEVLDAARQQNLTLVGALERLLSAEASATAARRLANRLRAANLPHPHTWGDFDFSAQPGVDEKLVRELASLRFLDDIGNLRYQNVPNDHRRRDTSAA